MAEVLVLHGQQRFRATRFLKEKVTNFFKNEYISVQNVTRQVGELARDLVWDHGIQPKDAIHVASATIVEAPILETYDGPLIAKVEKLGIPL